MFAPPQRPCSFLGVQMPKPKKRRISLLVDLAALLVLIPFAVRYWADTHP